MSAEPIHSASYTKAGVLDKWVKQPTDSAPLEASNGEITYKEKWKGPFSSGNTILSHVKTGDTLASAHSSMGQHVEEFDAPTCPTRNNLTGVWKIKDVRVEELAAGDHCYLYLNSYADYNTSSLTALTDVEEMDTWSISWQSYSVDPWYFCSNGTDQPQPWSPSYEESAPQADWSKMANRGLIEAALGQNPEYKGNFLVYTPDKNVPDYKMYLDAASYYMAKKVGCNHNAVWHYPVITHQTQSKGNFSANYKSKGSLGADIDHEVTLDSDCPYAFPDNVWKWIKTGDDMQQVRNEATNTTTFTRRETFEGILSGAFDANYYGNGSFTHTENGIKTGRWTPECI